MQKTHALLVKSSPLLACLKATVTASLIFVLSACGGSDGGPGQTASNAGSGVLLTESSSDSNSTTPTSQCNAGLPARDQWTVEDLSTIPVAGLPTFVSYFGITAINDCGTLVGGATDARQVKNIPPIISFFSYKDGVTKPLGSLSSYTHYGAANAINSAGQIVGFSCVGGCNDLHAFLYSDATGMVDLGTLGGYYSEATAISENGQIAGYSQGADNRLHGFIYRDGQMINIGNIVAFAINDAGQVAGLSIPTDPSLPPTEPQRAMLYSNGILADLGALPGATDSIATAINNAGQIVGWSGIRAFGGKPFLYAGGTMTDLGSLGGVNGRANAINDKGQIVGASQTASGESRAFLYQYGKMIDLNALPEVAATGWVMTGAFAITKSGKILCNGEKDGKSRQFLLTPPMTVS